jgi:diguanylate cyclase (GGDEF)-like protein
MMEPPEIIDAATSILLVEDNPGDRRLIREMLNEAWTGKFEFVHAGSISEAIKHLPSPSSGCVLLDLSLPDADDVNTVAHLAAAAPDLPIVVLTGTRDGEEAALEAVRAGAQDYLVKGQVDGPLLTRTIRRAIERKRVEAHLAHRGLHDPLTGLPNRVLFMDRLALALVRSARRLPASVGVLFLDVDRFKAVNDRHGHAAGDELLMEVARRIQASLRPGDSVARFGGDEFCVLCVAGETDVVAVAKRIAATLKEPFQVRRSEVVVSGSIGISLSGSGPSDPEQLVRDADAAMYRAKERGRGRYELFDEEMSTRAVKRLETESRLRQAIEDGEFRLLYQPEVDIATGAIVAVEALVRWQHPERGLLPPADFIQVAEDTALIVPLGEWVMREACRQRKEWREAHHLNGSPPRLFLNMSARQLARPDLISTISGVVRESGVSADDLGVEIAETVLMEDVESTLLTLNRLRELGLSLSVDDFGTGFSSLRSLKNFPVDTLKVDKSFVDGLGRDTDDSAIAAAAVSLAHALGLTAVAEGVERDRQLSQLKQLGCDRFQGYLFAKPMPGESLSQLLASAQGTTMAAGGGN